MAFKSTLVHKAETCSLLIYWCVAQHPVDAFVGVVGIYSERRVILTDLTQQLGLDWITVAHSIVANGRVAFRSSFQDPSDGPILLVVAVLWSGEQIQVDAMFGD